MLVDGGSSIDILFRNSLPALKLTPAQLKPYDAQFWGVFSGQSSVPLGQITLPVQFGTPDHFRTEFVNFVVADFDGTYHAILGRPSLTKFMAVLHYSYLVLKIPTEKGVLTVRGNVYTAYTCEEESFKITKEIDLSIRMAETVAQATQMSADQLKLPKQETPRKSTKSGAQGSPTGRRQPRQDGPHRGQSGYQIGRHARQVSKGQHKHFCVETRGHARHPTKPDRALLKRLKDRKTYQAEATTVRS